MVNKDYSKKKVAVVLSGGSARGYAHIGVLKGLEEMGIRPSIIVGTSMGSIVGALYCWNPHWKWVAAGAKKYKIKDMFSPKEIFNPKQGLFKGNRFESILRETISDAKFEDLQIPLVVNASDVASGKTVTFTKGKVADAVRASMSIPLIFKPLSKGSRILVDGGLTENLYFRYLLPKAHEYDLFVLVSVSGEITRLNKNTSVFGIMMQCFNIMMGNQIRLSLKVLEKDPSPNSKLFCSKMVYIKPNVKEMSVADFGKVEDAIRKGYSAFIRSKTKIESMLSKSK